MRNAKKIIIIGGGCSGVLTAIQLLLQTKKPIHIEIYDKNSNLGHGVAYATKYSEHLLNVISQNMSAVAEDKNHFLAWLQANNLDANPLGFMPRKIYAQYLQASLQQAITNASQYGATLKFINTEITDLSSQQLADHHIVLAVGIFIQPDPWQLDLATIKRDASIAIVGSGLSMVDIILSLKVHDHTGPITVFAKNGSLPLAHDLASFNKKLNINWSTNTSVLNTLREFRHYLRTYTQQGYSWHSVIDSLRPYTQQIWQSWDETNKRRFLRHLRSKWNLHRHRIAPQISQQLQDLKKIGFFQLEHSKVNLTAINTSGFSDVINCSGLVADYTQANSALLRNLFSRGIIKPGILGMGFETNLHLIGFPRHGKLWESVAVPELRQQAAEIADYILYKD